MSEKLYAELAKVYPSLRESDGLDIRLKQINGFNNSIQNIKDTQNFYNHEAKKYKTQSKTFKFMNGLNQSIDGVLLLGASSTATTAITLCITGVGFFVVPIASGIGAGVSIFSKFIGEYLKRKEQHILKKYTLAGGTLKNFQKLHTKCLEDNKTDLNE